MERPFILLENGVEKRIDRTGLSQVYGTWYEGEEPYEHDLWFTYNEASHCPREVIEEMGFKVL